MELKGKKLNILGDSITEGVGASGPEHGFVRLLENRSGALCRNYGVAGTRIAPQHCEPAGDDFCTRALQMDPEAAPTISAMATRHWGRLATARRPPSGARCTPCSPAWRKGFRA